MLIKGKFQLFSNFDTNNEMNFFFVKNTQKTTNDLKWNKKWIHYTMTVYYY